jgi:hypothetical protein
MSPKDENELQHMLWTAIALPRPVAIRYPRGSGIGVPLDADLAELPLGRAEVLRQGGDLAILAFGPLVQTALAAADVLARNGVEATVVNARYAKPLDEDLILRLAQEVELILTIEENALAIVSEYDVVVDASDNFPTRYLANDACVLAGKPLVHGSIYRFDGQATVFMPGQGCYRCLFPAPPPPGTVPSCAEAGVLGVLPGVIGTIQATETIKVLLGIGRTLASRLLVFDALAMEFREVQLRRNPACPVCGDNPTIRELIDYEEFCGLAPSRGNR